MNINQDTICAIATAQGGAIGIIRVSGPRAIEITSSVFAPIQGAPLSDRRAYTLTFGKIYNEENEEIDEVLVSLFKAPHSYTGEDSTEIACHGSSYILQQVMQLLIRKGCRMANPGEYTQRAFLNGKMDLSQAEAVADLVSSSSAATHRLAINQMRGGFSKELKNLRDQLLHITSLIELELDFSDHEELEFANRDELKALASHIEETIAKLTNSFNVGNAIKNGVPVAIIGETNAGKSTLLNLLLHEDKAIVSDIHGTTRDVIEDTINVQGITFRFIDTAGIRQTEDEIENLGIERTFQQMRQANIILWMVDSTDLLSRLHEIKKEVIPHIGEAKLLVLFNKSDLINEQERQALLSDFTDVPSDKMFISAKYGKQLNELENKLVCLSAIPEVTENDFIVTNVRHYEALSKALDSIRRVLYGLKTGLSGDLISEDLRQCIYELSDIVGDVTTDEVLGNIFKNFCIGK